jgi:hypothetical protein
MTQTAYCRRCRKQVGYHYDPVNHWKQLLLTIGTVGLWLPMWICMAFSPTKLCNDCNEPIWDGMPAIRPQRG